MTAQIFKMANSAYSSPPHGLSDQSCFAIAAFLQTLPGYWLAQRDEDAKGAVFMTIFPNTEINSGGGCAAAGSYIRPSFIVHQDQQSFRLSGSLTKRVSRYETLETLLHALRGHTPGGF